jgi:putative membrane protein
MPSSGVVGEGSGGFVPTLRVHPVSWVFVAAGYLKQFLVPVIATLVVGSNRDAGMWLPLIVVVPLVAAALWHQWVFRYGFSERGLVVHEGLLFRNVRTVDYSRIENVDTERSVLHRLFGVAEVRVETSTGGKPEALIRVLSLPAVEAMRERIFAERREGDAGASLARAGAGGSGETLLEVPPRELVLLGLIDNRGMIVVAAILGILAQSGFFEDLGANAPRAAQRLPWDRLFDLGGLAPVALAVLAAAVLIAGTRVLSVILALLTLWGFRLTRTSDDLHARFGLLTRVSVTLRRRRVQSVHQTATLLHRAFRRVSLRVDLAGGIGAGGGQETGGQSARRELWLAPICGLEHAERLVRAALPRASLDGLDWHGLAPRARSRIFRLQTSVWWLVAAWPAIWIAGAATPWAAALLLLGPVPFLWLHATLYARHTGWALNDDVFVLRRGWLTRKLSVAPRNRIQSVRLAASPFDRRHAMARIELDNAGAGAASHRLSLRYLPRGDAERLLAALYRSGFAAQRA